MATTEHCSKGDRLRHVGVVCAASRPPLTERILGRQLLATQIFVRGFSDVRGAVEAFVDGMEDAANGEVERVAKELNGALATLVLELLGDRELRDLVRSFRAGSDAAPA